ncbi:MAG TPA: GDSL-type esterase/lipase family protein [Croceibacterium sp.]
MKALLAASALLAPAFAHAAPCAGPVCNLDTLSPYFARLAAAGPAPGVPPVHIIQIGDSHTAGDAISGTWRELLQARAGDGGRGVLPPGRPYNGYLTRGVTASMSPGWRVSATFGEGWTGAFVPLGLSSHSLTSTAPGATMGLVADPGRTFDRFVVCARAGPGAGPLVVQLGDGTAQRLILDGPEPAPRCETIRTLSPQASVSLTAPDGPITVTSWAVFNDQGGVALSNLGVIGAQLRHFRRADDALLAEELRAYAPDLIVLAFGTNEGFAPHLDAADYESALRGQIARLQGLAPGVPLLLLGPPDALSRNAALRGNRGDEATRCPREGRTQPLFAPPALAEVRRIQRAVAGELGVAWWDWQASMGGPCAAARWVEAGLMRADHVHFRTAGGALIARALQDDLERAETER